MTTLREAAQQALEALNELVLGVDVDCGDPHCDDCNIWRPAWAAITTLRAALEQPEQRTIAVLTEDRPDGCDYDDCINYDENELCYRWSSGDCPGPRNKK
jgi:hypothetical protein